MVYLATSDEWQRQSSLLLQARPTTTRITTKYKIPNLEEAKYSRPRKRRRGAEDASTDSSSATPKVPRALLVLKTFDPESGVCLKFKTDRAAEVGRLVGGLGRLGRHMAALPKAAEDVPMEDATAPPTHHDANAGGSVIPSTVLASTDAGSGAGGAAGKKKKKGKK